MSSGDAAGLSTGGGRCGLNIGMYIGMNRGLPWAKASREAEDRALRRSAGDRGSHKIVPTVADKWSFGVGLRVKRQEAAGE